MLPQQWYIRLQCSTMTWLLTVILMASSIYVRFCNENYVRIFLRECCISHSFIKNFNRLKHQERVGELTVRVHRDKCATVNFVDTISITLLADFPDYMFRLCFGSSSGHSFITLCRTTLHECGSNSKRLGNALDGNCLQTAEFQANPVRYRRQAPWGSL